MAHAEDSCCTISSREGDAQQLLMSPLLTVFKAEQVLGHVNGPLLLVTATRSLSSRGRRTHGLLWRRHQQPVRTDDERGSLTRTDTGRPADGHFTPLPRLAGQHGIKTDIVVHRDGLELHCVRVEAAAVGLPDVGPQVVLAVILGAAGRAGPHARLSVLAVDVAI